MTIKATCHVCGDVYVERHADVAIVWKLGLLRYRFDCPDCGQLVERDTTEHIAGFLAGCGCTVDWDPPFRPSDVARFRAQLNRRDWAALLDA